MYSELCGFVVNFGCYDAIRQFMSSIKELGFNCERHFLMIIVYIFKQWIMRILESSTYHAIHEPTKKT